MYVTHSLRRSLVRSHRLTALWVALSATVVFTAVAPALASAASSPNLADEKTTIVDTYIVVREADGLVNANVALKNGDDVDISASGSIWPGVWFRAPNGPEGWEGWSANNDSPLPGAAPFSLLGHTAEEGYFFVGRGLRWTYQNASLGSRETGLGFEINDDLHGGGDGFFQVHLIVRR